MELTGWYFTPAPLDVGMGWQEGDGHWLPPNSPNLLDARIVVHGGKVYLYPPGMVTGCAVQYSVTIAFVALFTNVGSNR